MISETKRWKWRILVFHFAKNSENSINDCFEVLRTVTIIWILIKTFPMTRNRADCMYHNSIILFKTYAISGLERYEFANMLFDAEHTPCFAKCTRIRWKTWFVMQNVNGENHTSVANVIGCRCRGTQCSIHFMKWNVWRVDDTTCGM